VTRPWSAPFLCACLFFLLVLLFLILSFFIGSYNLAGISNHTWPPHFSPLLPILVCVDRFSLSTVLPKWCRKQDFQVLSALIIWKATRDVSIESWFLSSFLFTSPMTTTTTNCVAWDAVNCFQRGRWKETAQICRWDSAIRSLKCQQVHSTTTMPLFRHNLVHPVGYEPKNDQEEEKNRSEKKK